MKRGGKAGEKGMGKENNACNVLTSPSPNTSVLSRELTRPAGEGMWGKRRPVGPQTLRGMIRQQQQAAAAAAIPTTTSVGNKNGEGQDEPQATINNKRLSTTTTSSASSSSKPSTTASPPASSTKYGILQPNMVVTIEPGIYFCRPYIEWHFLRDGSEHRRYFDVDVLQQYWDVGGVRIEDCILVTPGGHENLTSAPKCGVDDENEEEAEDGDVEY